MSFEVFTKQTAALSGQPYISVQRKGILSLNQAAYVALGEPVAVELLYDRKRSLLGLRAADPDVEHSQAVRPTSNDSAHVVTATRFTKHYGISTDVGRRWPAEMEGGVLFIDISRPPQA